MLVDAKGLGSKGAFGFSAQSLVGAKADVFDTEDWLGASVGGASAKAVGFEGFFSAELGGASDVSGWCRAWLEGSGSQKAWVAVCHLEVGCST
ncbi:hypothetical protein NDU88_000254 [Pleurodeles waltl]|uniref:Uncharacterized protein n=1 Tax=Pleurodeles waltl TaxID=8319 RepID=A0AAV7VVK7_PLEWA|nr:hypothetical protein NDU88_000254 [Pleurodeles waltl]